MTINILSGMDRTFVKFHYMYLNMLMRMNSTQTWYWTVTTGTYTILHVLAMRNGGRLCECVVRRANNNHSSLYTLVQISVPEEAYDNLGSKAADKRNRSSSEPKHNLVAQVPQVRVFLQRRSHALTMCLDIHAWAAELVWLVQFWQDHFFCPMIRFIFAVILDVP